VLRWDEDKPVHSSGDKWEGVGCRVEDAEPGAVSESKSVGGVAIRISERESSRSWVGYRGEGSRGA